MAPVPVECGMVVGEASFKWAALRPKPDAFDFTEADRLMSFATRQGLRARGHTLVWHEGNPSWLPTALSPATGEALLVRHIQGVAGHFRGQLVHWDVANEVLQPDDGRPDGLRDTLWLRALGPRYLDLAFHACADADPGALRVLNEFGTDYALPWQERRRGALLALLANMKAHGVPVQAVGLQGHLNAAEPAPDQTLLARFVDDIAALGLQVIVTELDVRDDQLPGDPVQRDAAVASHARAWLDAVLASPAVLGVLSWGLSDGRSWLNEKFPRADGLPQRPLPLDAQMRRKPLWTEMAAAFDAAPFRSAVR
jgi:endo-1,4-beta-xylanase